jgi:hypothetical protein
MARNWQISFWAKIIADPNIAWVLMPHGLHGRLATNQLGCVRGNQVA